MDGVFNSRAVTASELARHPPLAWDRNIQNFLTHGTAIDFARTAETPKLEAYHTYVLRQTSYNTKSLVSAVESIPTSYSFKSHATSGFMNKRPHILVTRDVGGRRTRLAEVWLDAHGYGSKIVYIDMGTEQQLTRNGAEQQRFWCSIVGVAYIWQPLGPSRNVLELVNETGRRAALFVYAETVFQRSVSLSGSSMRIRAAEIGRLHIMSHAMGQHEVLERICCTAVVVVEKAKQKVKMSGTPSSGVSSA